jgi:glutathione peroxidase
MGVVASAFAFVNKLRVGKIKPANGSIYDFKIAALNGEVIDFNEYRGKRLLIVNTASKCVYTSQYEELQELHEQFPNEVTVLGFPSNDFLWQDPGSNVSIQNFCSTHYGVTFQMFSKVPVIGSSAHPLFKWLAGRTGTFPSWNFCKYLIDPDGKEVEFFNSKISPTDQKIISKLK